MSESHFDPPQITEQIPAEIEAERALLGALILNPDMLDDICAVVTPEDFYSPQHRALLKALLELSAKNEPLDLVTIQDHMNRMGTLDDAGGIAYIAALEQYCVSSSSAPRYAKRIAELSTLRALIKTASSIIREAREQADSEGTPLEAPTIVERASQAIFTLGDRSNSNVVASSPIGEALARVSDDIEAIRSGKKSGLGLLTHQPDLDLALGGFIPQGLYLIAARPSIGKSALALQIALSIARGADVHLPASYRRGLPVLFISLEMSEKQVAIRAASALTGIDSQKIRKGQLTDEELERFGAATAQVRSVPLRIYEGTKSVPQIRSIIRRAKTKNPNYGLAVIDYLQLIKWNSTVNTKGVRLSREAIVGEISHELKQISVEYKIPLLCVCALNRQSENDNRKPRLSDLRESGSLEYDAEAVIFIHREFPGGGNGKGKNPYRDGEEERPSGPPKYSLILGKNRDGMIGEFPVLFDGPTTTYRSLVRR